jgi:hypothetical protein
MGRLNVKLVARGRIDGEFSILPDVFCPVIWQHCMRKQRNMEVVLLVSMQTHVGV